MANVFAPRYAHALAQVVVAKNLDPNAAQRQMRDFAGTLAGSPQLHEILMDPSIAEEQKLRLLDAIALRIGMMREVRNFLAVVMDHHRLDALSDILAEYDLVADEGAGIAEAEITSAHELNPDDRAALEAEVAKLAGGQVRATYTQDASLLGGAIVRLGSTVYDGSVRGQLQQLKAKLMQA